MRALHYIDRLFADTRRELDRHYSELVRLSEREAGLLSIENYEQRHRTLEARLQVLEAWRANLTGRLIAFGILGGLLISVLGAFIGHLLS